MSAGPYARIARSVICLVAGLLIMFSLCFVAADGVRYFSDQPLPGAGALCLHGLPLLAGVVLFLASGAIAARVTRDLD